MRWSTSPRAEAEDHRRRQLIDATIETLADVGFNAATLGEIARRAGVSAGLVAHYFGDKDGLLEATLRHLASRLRRSAVERLAMARTPRGRVQAIIDANLAPEEFDRRTASVWLAFWGQVIHSARFRRVQNVYQRRMVSNLRHSLKALLPAQEAQSVAVAVAALVDGLWLRATLAGDAEPEASSIRTLAAHFVDAQVAAAAERAAAVVAEGEGAVAARIAEPAAQTFVRLDPTTGAVLAEIAIAGEAEVDRAVAAARAAQPAWAALLGAERGRVLRRVAEILRTRREALARLESRDTGTPIRETLAIDLPSAADWFEQSAGLAATLAGEHVALGAAAFAYSRREPLGILPGLGGGSRPFRAACRVAAPALAAGNAMIFAPDRCAPLGALRLAEILREAGVPDGIFSVVQGGGEAEAILRRRLGFAAPTCEAALSAREGKSVFVVFDDADLDAAVRAVLHGLGPSADRVCPRGVCVHVDAAIREAFVAELVARVSRSTIGDPLDPATEVGPRISPQHLADVLDHVATGLAQGARLVAGGHRLGPAGWFVAPAVFDHCSDEMTVVREGIAGPVAAILAFDGADEAIARLAAGPAGPTAAVFTRDLARAHRVVARLAAATCWINPHDLGAIAATLEAAWGSGLGRAEAGTALDAVSRAKRVHVDLGSNCVDPTPVCRK